MAILKGRAFGTPKNHEEEKSDHEVVKMPEFDVTQYAKKLAVMVGVVAAAAASALKLFKVDQVTSGMVIGAFGVTAAALLGVSLVIAVDIASRAYLTDPRAGEKGRTKDKDGDDEPEDDDPAPGSGVVGAPAGTMAWLEDDDEPHPVLAIAGDGGKASAYLVAAGSTVERPQGGKSVKAIDGAPKWHSADAIRAVKPTKWP